MGKTSQNLSSAAVVIGAFRVNADGENDSPKINNIIIIFYIYTFTLKKGVYLGLWLRWFPCKHAVKRK